MNKIDLRLNYKSNTGKYPTNETYEDERLNYQGKLTYDYCCWLNIDSLQNRIDYKFATGLEPTFEYVKNKKNIVSFTEDYRNWLEDLKLQEK